MENPKVYKVISPKDIYLSWTKNLLPVEWLKEWETYKLQELQGRTDEERNSIRHTPESLRLMAWCNINGYGVDEMQEMYKKGEIQKLPLNYHSELKFKLPAGESIVSARQYEELKKFEIKMIKQKLQPGEITPRYDQEGFLEITETSLEKEGKTPPVKGIKNKFLNENE